jgi:hypothetical protein
MVNVNKHLERSKGLAQVLRGPTLAKTLISLLQMATTRHRTPMIKQANLRHNQPPKASRLQTLRCFSPTLTRTGLERQSQSGAANGVGEWYLSIFMRDLMQQLQR